MLCRLKESLVEALAARDMSLECDETFIDIESPTDKAIQLLNSFLEGQEVSQMSRSWLQLQVAMEGCRYGRNALATDTRPLTRFICDCVCLCMCVTSGASEVDTYMHETGQLAKQAQNASGIACCGCCCTACLCCGCWICTSCLLVLWLLALHLLPACAVVAGSAPTALHTIVPIAVYELQGNAAPSAEYGYNMQLMRPQAEPR